MSRNNNLTWNPCTLVYTLLDDSVISFDDFYLLIRGSHSFQVEAFVPKPEYLTVHVKLKYEASTVNAQRKLGELSSYISVTKLSSFVKDDELSKLDQLRKRFGITGESPQQQYAPVQSRRGRGGNATRRFNPRPAPYQPKPSTSAAEEPSIPNFTYPELGENDEQSFDC